MLFRKPLTCTAGTVCGCGLCRERLQWYDRYLAWNVAQLEEEYEGLVGAREAGRPHISQAPPEILSNICRYCLRVWAVSGAVAVV